MQLEVFWGLQFVLTSIVALIYINIIVLNEFMRFIQKEVKWENRREREKFKVKGEKEGRA